jgi:hypothetical protein
MGASGSSDMGATQPAPPPIPSHPAGTEPAAAPNQPPSAPYSSAAHLDNVLQGVERIRMLETEHKCKLALLTAKRQGVANLQKQYEEVRLKLRSACRTTSVTLTFCTNLANPLSSPTAFPFFFQMMKTADANSRQEVEELDVMNQELYESQMKQLSEKQEAVLEAKMLHVNTYVLRERTRMQREDAEAFIIRELENTWIAELQELRTAQKREGSQQFSIAKQAYERKYSEIVSNLEAEYADAMSKAKTSRQESRKRRSSGGFLSGWFSPSPSKKPRGEGGGAHTISLSGGQGSDEEEEDDMDSDAESS